MTYARMGQLAHILFPANEQHPVRSFWFDLALFCQTFLFLMPDSALCGTSRVSGVYMLSLLAEALLCSTWICDCLPRLSAFAPTHSW